jgi:hypothetical protein
LSGIFQVEIASGGADLAANGGRSAGAPNSGRPNKARLDALITRWLECHLQRLRAEIELKRIHSRDEDNAMLAENLKSWTKRKREEGRQECKRIGRQKGCQEAARATTRNLIALGMLTTDRSRKQPGSV